MLYWAGHPLQDKGAGGVRGQDRDRKLRYHEGFSTVTPAGYLSLRKKCGLHDALYATPIHDAVSCCLTQCRCRAAWQATLLTAPSDLAAERQSDLRPQGQTASRQHPKHTYRHPGAQSALLPLRLRRSREAIGAHCTAASHCFPAAQTVSPLLFPR